ncbi:YppG family protein [Neobacillus sp. CF12]|uniref:YppG family protein n=1 Tax=Neobacillus sp. CF12 TaxID=3055864 RepID=UPI0025A1444E|nr:YppG family protein [Neobacillus sp. CF12]MDM5331266.1 YppG family protein [Neobacillus sp. CF12]
MYGRNRSNYYLNHGYLGQMNYREPGYYQSHYQPVPRNQPYHYQEEQSMEWYPYQQHNPYFQQSFQQPYQPPYHPYESTFQPSGNLLQMPNPTGYYPPKDAQFLFQNPLQPKEEMTPNPYMQQMNGYSVMNPYPKSSGMLKQPGGIQSLMNSFKSQDGTVDVNKMVNTAGQMVNAVTQVSSLVKGLGGIFKA